MQIGLIIANEKEKEEAKCIDRTFVVTLYGVKIGIARRYRIVDAP